LPSPALFSSDRPDWNTPAEVLELVRHLGPIGLDPCSNAASIVGAAVEWRLPEVDGLEMPWGGHGLVFLNPPYGRGINLWTRRCCIVPGVRPPEDQVVALVPARTDTAWWTEAVEAVDAVCFWRGRLTFLGAPNPAPFPSALLYYGPHRHRFASIFEPRGWVVLP
jgi:phage N-6-adenine-methyltransferase